MSDIVRVERDGDIGLICLTKPPVNALGVALRSAVFDALAELVADTSVRAIVLYGEGRLFSAGADIKDFARAAETPTLPDLLKALNDSAKPVVSVLHGVAFGGALELALATHLRVGITGVKVGLPEVTLGLLPGAGGTQRLTRLTGIAPVIDIICKGRHVADSEALELGIITRLEDGDARDAGLRAARDVLSGTLTAQPTDDLMVAADDAALAAARIRYAKGLIAPQRAIDAIEAATLPIEQGLKRERALFMELMQGDERAGLVHAFFAERATTKIPERGTQTRTVETVGVVGGGTMGVGIATAILIAGRPVTLIETQDEAAARAQKAIEANLSGALKRGKLTVDSHAAAVSALSCVTDIEALSDVDLVIEAIFEDMATKTGIFAKLDAVCKQGCILATNTSYLDVNEIAEATKRPQDVIGLHFFSPAHIMRLLEVVVGAKTAPEVTATVFDVARMIRKVPVRAEVCDGFIGNRILTTYRKACEYLVLDGADFAAVDQALEGFGFAMGPFAVGDLAGLDVAKATRDRKAATRPPEERYSPIADRIVDQGWFGRKTEAGYYVYDGTKKTGTNAGAVDIMHAERKALGLTPQEFSHQDIVDRCLTAMIMEATGVVQEGVALRPVDIDAVQLFGYGFPRHKGGPMHLADQIGAQALIDRIEAYALQDPYFWRVPELLRDMVATGRTFADLNVERAEP